MGQASKKPPGRTPGGLRFRCGRLLAGDRFGFGSARYVSDLAILSDFELIALRFLTANGDLGTGAADFHDQGLAVSAVESDFFPLLNLDQGTNCLERSRLLNLGQRILQNGDGFGGLDERGFHQLFDLRAIQGFNGTPALRRLLL